MAIAVNERQDRQHNITKMEHFVEEEKQNQLQASKAIMVVVRASGSSHHFMP